MRHQRFHRPPAFSAPIITNMRQRLAGAHDAAHGDQLSFRRYDDDALQVAVDEARRRCRHALRSPRPA